MSQRGYSVADQTVAALTNNVSFAGLLGGAAARPSLYEVMVSSGLTPAEQTMGVLVRRFTADGTGATAITPQPNDPADPTAVVAGRRGYTGEPTGLGNLQLRFAAHQKPMNHWVTYPEDGIVIPATAGAGLALTAVSPGYSQCSFVLRFRE